MRKDRIIEALKRAGRTPEEIQALLKDIGKHLDIETGEWLPGLLP